MKVITILYVPFSALLEMELRLLAGFIYIPMKHWLDIFPLFPRRDALVKCKQLNTTERLKLKLSVCIKFSGNAKSRGLGVPRGLK